MNSIVKKYTFLAFITAVVLASSTSIYAANNTPIISKILSSATQDSYPKALKILNNEIETNKDIRLELLIIKAQLNFKNQNSNEAIEIYRKLITEYPDNLLLYNNLSTIYASQGDLNSAELTLLNGIKSQSNFDVVYQNLMKIKGKQAAQALQLALNPTAITSNNLELTTLNRLANGIDFSLPPQESNQSTLIAENLAERTNTNTTGNALEYQPPITPEVLKTEKTYHNQDPIENKPIQKIEPEENDQNTPSTEAQSISAEDEISQLLTAWADEWSKGNAESYLSFYSHTFDPEGNLSIEKWAAQRRQRISPNSGINVQLENIKFKTINTNMIEARFKQIYNSRTLKARANKIITFEKQNNGWKIIQERVVK